MKKNHKLKIKSLQRQLEKINEKIQELFLEHATNKNWQEKITNKHWNKVIAGGLIGLQEKQFCLEQQLATLGVEVNE